MAGAKPAILLGHSIGGMITLTFCRMFSNALRAKVQAIVFSADYLHQSDSYDKNGGLFTAIEQLFIVPLLHLTIWLSPLLWLSNWMSYLNGSALLSTKSSGFAGTETYEQVNFVTRFQLQASPAVLARGMFGNQCASACGGWE
jgi:alpha-beta hydrolase superfamily lysophospholipase